MKNPSLANKDLSEANAHTTEEREKVWKELEKLALPVSREEFFKQIKKKRSK